LRDEGFGQWAQPDRTRTSCQRESAFGNKQDPKALRAYRAAVADAIRDHHVRGEAAGRWAPQFLIRRCAWHMLDHAWDDRNLTAE